MTGIAKTHDGFTIESPTRLRSGKRVLIYAHPRWVRLDGVTWTAIEDVVNIAETSAGVYIVTIGKTKIQLKVKTSLSANVLKRSVVKPKHFGPVFDSTLVPDYLQFEVKVLQGVAVQQGLGWVAATYDGVSLGLFLNEWAKYSPVVVGEIVTLDLRAAKAAGGEINLDPTVVATTGTGYITSFSSTTWSAARAGSSLATAEDGVYPHAGNPFSTYFFCNQGFFRFDTSGIVSVARADLCIKPAFKDSAATLRLYRLAADHGTLTTSDWGAATSATEADISTASLSVDAWYTVSLDPAGIATGAHSAYMIREKDHDVDNVKPSAGVSYGVKFYGPVDAGSEPYLDITEAAAFKPYWIPQRNRMIGATL